MTEEWRDVSGYDGAYQVSNLGRVRSVDRLIPYADGTSRRKRGKILDFSVKRDGYMQVALHERGKTKTPLVHVLVAQEFIGPRPTGMYICHNNGDPSDNSVENLRYDTPASNSRDAIKHGRNPNSNKTHCKRGHPYSGKNLREYRPRGESVYRICIACRSMHASVTKAIRRDGRLNSQEKAVIEELRREREATMIASASNTK